MTVVYPFVSAYHVYGARKAPALALAIHMAEGGGTVGYLSRDAARGVSVHFVIERTGRTVQMLDLAAASGSVDPTKVRTTNDADGFYGVSHARQVLGDWARDPNSAVISVEIEGYASIGPNAIQHDALADWAADMRQKVPTLRGALGHRDFASYKACPGRRIDWTRIGGHGLWAEEDDMPLPHATVRERWKPTETNGRSNGVLRARPDRSAPLLKDAAGNVIRLPVDEEIVTCAEYHMPGFQRGGDDFDWRLLETREKAAPRFLLRADLESLGLVVDEFNAGVEAGSKAALTARR